MAAIDVTWYYMVATRLLVCPHDLMVVNAPKRIMSYDFITPHAYARGKVIGCVRPSVSTIITRSEDSGILTVSKHDNTVGSSAKLSYFCFLMVDTRHEHLRLCWPCLSTTPSKTMC